MLGYNKNSAKRATRKRVNNLVNEQHIRDNNTSNIIENETQNNHPPRDNQFGVIYAMSTPKQVSNAVPVITQDDKEADCKIDNRSRTYTNNIQTNLLQF